MDVFIGKQLNSGLAIGIVGRVRLRALLVLRAEYLFVFSYYQGVGVKIGFYDFLAVLAGTVGRRQRERERKAAYC